MALKGNLRDFTITQLLNLINLARKTGTLVIEGPNDTAWISFREGKLAYSKMGKEKNNLATILYRSKKIVPIYNEWFGMFSSQMPSAFGLKRGSRR